MVPSDSLDHPPQGLGRGVHVPFTHVRVQTPARPVGIGGQRITGNPRCRRGGPPGRHLRLTHPLQGEGEGCGERERTARAVRDVLRDVVLVADHFIAQGLGERTGDRGRDRRDQADPVAGQSGGEHRHGQDQPTGEPGDPRVLLHHVPVRQGVGASDVERAVHLRGHRRAADQVAQHVPDRDRLDARRHPARGDHDPARGDHDRQPLREVAQHLERRRTRTEDDRRAQDRRRHPRGEKDVTDLGPRTQVRRQLALGHPGRGQPAQVHDAPHAGGPRPLTEDTGRRAVGLLEAGPAAQGVDQVVGDVDVPHRRAEGLGVGRIPLGGLDLAGPGVVPQLLGVARQAAHPVTGVQEFGYEPAPDVPRGAGHQASQPASVVASLHGRSVLSRFPCVHGVVSTAVPLVGSEASGSGPGSGSGEADGRAGDDRIRDEVTREEGARWGCTRRRCRALGAGRFRNGVPQAISGSRAARWRCPG